MRGVQEELLKCGKVIMPETRVWQLVKGQGRNNTKGGPAKDTMCAN
jgi:hypothetical protein